MVFDRTLCRCLIHVADPTLWDKAWLLFNCMHVFILDCFIKIRQLKVKVNLLNVVMLNY
jgi:hypothetical protein